MYFIHLCKRGKLSLAAAFFTQTIADFSSTIYIPYFLQQNHLILSQVLPATSGALQNDTVMNGKPLLHQQVKYNHLFKYLLVALLLLAGYQVIFQTGKFYSFTTALIFKLLFHQSFCLCSVISLSFTTIFHAAFHVKCFSVHKVSPACLFIYSFY